MSGLGLILDVVKLFFQVSDAAEAVTGDGRLYVSELWMMKNVLSVTLFRAR